MLPYPIIFVPGITATHLRNFYPLPSELVWSLNRKRFDQLALHPNDLRYESKQPSMVRADQVFAIAYEELIEELRAELKELAGAEVPVYAFGYDWRQPLEVTQLVLKEFVEEVIDRTRLLPHYQKAYKNRIKVNLVGHSMGGLLIARMLAENSGLPVNKVATLATPFQGSFEAVVKMTVGTGNLGNSKPSHIERKAARVTPALYQLLPAFKLELENAPGQKHKMIDERLPQILFKPEVWQPSVAQAIRDFVKDTGLPTPDPARKGDTLFKRLLQGAKSNFRAVARLDLSNHGLKDKDWLAVVGVDSKTRVEMQVTAKGAKKVPSYTFLKDHARNLWDDDQPPFNWLETGDGTVPLAGALPPFLSHDQLVLISPEDYGTWELQDKALSTLGGFHGVLPNMNLVQRLLIRYFSNSTDPHNNTWGRALPGIDHWNPPMKLGRPENNFKLS